MTTLSLVELETVTGGARGQRSDQIRDRYRSLCLSPNPEEARRHYDIMVERMRTGGVWPRTIKAMGQLCGWPVPPDARNARPL